ncbi:uncharacterized protein LOC122072786 [Macadamia integrifolia]|uniref:uncharacterized protein LOC122072786 n=1 Tax=Macadamia integrifolia TaxID=60698 RepID=UPI001C4FDC9E|nr:uncharacterized protein LOC122072786 [Macadamia integrifolia]
MEEAQKSLEEVQHEIEVNGMDDQIFVCEADAKTRHLKAIESYDKLWVEKSRSRWRLQGDRCFKFFHITAKVRRIKNTIRVLKDGDGRILSEKNQLEGYVSYFYKSFLKRFTSSNHLDMLDCIPSVLTDIDRWRLDVMPSNAEITEAVWDLDPECSPRPDGLPGTFYRACWDIIYEDVCNVVRGFFSRNLMPYGMNNNFFVLIPKSEGAMSLDKFRALCMGNFFCKIVTKIMAMRLSIFLPRLISEEQGAFRKGKIIHSNISVASELSNMMFSTARGGGMSLKIYIQKAYDTISWDFVSCFEEVQLLGKVDILGSSDAGVCKIICFSKRWPSGVLWCGKRVERRGSPIPHAIYSG